MNLVFPAIVAAVALAAAALWRFRDTVANVMAAAVDIMSRLSLGILTQFDKLARISDKYFKTDLHASIAKAASDIEQFRVDTGDSLRGYADSVRDAGVATEDAVQPMEDLAATAAGGSVGTSLAPSVKVVKEELDLLVGTVTIFSEREVEAKRKADDFLNSLLGSQGLVDGVQTLRVGFMLASTEVDLFMDGLPAKVRSTGSLWQRASGFATNFLDDVSAILSPAAISGIFTAAFTGGGGVLGALKAIGSQLAGALANSFLGPLSSAISSGIKGVFTGGAGAAAGSAAVGSGGSSLMGDRCRDSGVGLGGGGYRGRVHVF